VKKTVSVCITAYNEEFYIEETVLNILEFLKNLRLDYEIVIVNDGSQDNTGKIIKNLSKKDRRVRVVEHKVNMGVARTIIDGIKNARKEYFTYIPGDNQFSLENFKDYFKEIEKYDLLIGYIKNPKVRRIYRRIGSSLFVFFVRLFFNIKVKYTNGLNLIRRELLDGLKLESVGHTISSEIIIKILKFRNVRYKNIGFELLPKFPDTSTAFRIGSILNSFIFILSLWFKIYILKKRY